MLVKANLVIFVLIGQCEQKITKKSLNLQVGGGGWQAHTMLIRAVNTLKYDGYIGYIEFIGLILHVTLNTQTIST